MGRFLRGIAWLLSRLPIEGDSSRSTLLHRIRWRVALTLNDLDPSVCWANLGTWAMGWTEWDEIDWGPGSCDSDAARRGACWCGKKVR